MYYYDVLELTQCKGKEFDLLLAFGWYPMGQTVFTTSHLFRDNDPSPHKVYWLRYHVDAVSDRTSHRRIRRKNRHFEVQLAEPFLHSPELNRMYEIYLNSVDFDGYSTIADATYRDSELNIYDSKAIIVKDGDKIISCGIFHEGESSVASVLHFYDPQYVKFSPGKYLILMTLDYCRQRGIEFYYPGYVIQGNPKMDYKLFLGMDLAEYYDPEPNPLSGKWLPFKSELLACESESKSS